MKKKFIVVILLTFFLSGCVQGDRYNFSGSSGNWEVFYVVDISNGRSQEKTGKIKYIGEGNPPKTVGYQIEANSGGSYAEGVNVIEGVAEAGRSICEGCAVIQKDDEIEVIITWDGETEKIQLTNQYK